MRCGTRETRTGHMGNTLRQMIRALRKTMDQADPHRTHTPSAHTIDPITRRGVAYTFLAISPALRGNKPSRAT